MPLCNAGLDLIAQLIIGAGTPLSHANAYLGVGDSTAAFNAAQTDLQATSNKSYKSVDTYFPTISGGNQITFQATFGPSDANFSWNEWAIFSGVISSGTMLVRKVETIGSGAKPSGATWILTLVTTSAGA
jgi:hypothetical protein